MNILKKTDYLIRIVNNSIKKKYVQKAIQKWRHRYFEFSVPFVKSICPYVKKIFDSLSYRVDYQYLRIYNVKVYIDFN